MIKTIDIAWLAGLVEGEGSFLFNTSDSPGIAIQMSDRDIVARVAAMFNRNVTGPYKPRYEGSKESWSCRCHGKDAIAWMMTLYPLMGERRQEKIRDILYRWKTYVPPKRMNKFCGSPYKKPRTTPTCGHPERRAITENGMCQVCYMRQYRADRAAAAVAQGIA